MAKVKKLSFMQLKYSGLSNAKRTVLEKYIDDMKPDFISLNETKQRIPHDSFKNYRMFSHHQQAHHGGLALSLPKDISCCEIQNFQKKTFDSIWCAVYLGHKSFILATAYIPPIAEDRLKGFLDSLEDARAYDHRSNMTGVILMGDLNARSLLWGDTRCNKSGEILENFVKKPEVNILNDGEYTFHAANGTSIIDLSIVTDSITSWNFSLFPDTEVELFTSYPNRGHIPVFVTFDITFKSSNRKTKFDLENADRDRWREALEKEASNWTDHVNRIYNSPDETCLTISKTLEEVNKLCIPTKICSVYSKPFRNKQLTNLSNNLRELRKRFKRPSTPGNLAALNDAREKFKKEVETAASNWTKQKLLDFNSAHQGNEFWKNFKKIFSNERDTMIGPLKCKNGLCFTVIEKADVLMDTFVSGKHLNEKDFDQNFEQRTNHQIELIRQLKQKQERDRI